MAIVLGRKPGGGSSGGGAPSGPAGGSLAGTFPDPTIAANAVDSAQIANDAVGTSEIAAGAVGRSELATGIGVFDRLFDTTLGADAASFDFTPIPGSYNSLKLFLAVRGTVAASQVIVNLRFNNDSSAIYDWVQGFWDGGGLSTSDAQAQTSGRLAFGPGGTATANKALTLEANIVNYAGTVFHKNAETVWSFEETESDGFPRRGGNMLAWRSTVAITRITVLPSSDNFLAGSRATLYGLA